MTDATVTRMSWAERAAERSPVVQRSRVRSVEQARTIVDAAQRLIAAKGTRFTIQELAKEAGVALQTFYRYFGGKDQLILAVIEDMVERFCHQSRARARDLPDPLARLRVHVTAVVDALDHQAGQGPQFITTEHWRLQALYPDEVARATAPFTDLLLEEISAAEAAGLLHPRDAAYDAWLVQQLVMAVFHFYAFAPEASHGDVEDRLWAFCSAALAGPSPSPPAGRRPARARSPRSRG